MIPALDRYGNLPPGLHAATVVEIDERFGHGSPDREAAMQSLHWLIPMCRRAGIARLILNGSFVTHKADPGDADCLLVPGPTYRKDSDATLALRVGLPYLSIEIVEIEEDLSYYLELFGSDRNRRPKGLVEVVL